jgi:Uma2 family endonuclease
MTTKPRATIADLYRVPDNAKAEIVNGEIVTMSPTGDLPGQAGGAIFASLRDYARRTKLGVAYPDNVGFAVDLPNRGSFSPDAAFYTGKRTGMQYLQGAPVFAAEVRSANDYGPSAEQAMAEKRTDYFAAGTQAVWDVDLRGEDVVRVYRRSAPDTPTIYRRGETAEAEPAVPGWRFAVDELFE